MSESRDNARLEAFCDGVFAIALTLLIIDVKLDAPESIRSTAELWRALQHLTPTVLAFLLSFIIIFVTWVNHHSVMRSVQRSTPAFMYANALLLLTVVFTPFPTALLGEFALTDHAAPAVFLYDAVLVVQALAWVAVLETALRGHLTDATQGLSEKRRNGYGAIVIYGVLAIVALWLPLTVAIVTTASWIFWLSLSIGTKQQAARRS